MTDMGDETYQSYRDDRSRVIGGLRLVERETQKHHLATVSSRIQGAIVEFFDLHAGQQFHAERLHEYVEARCGKTAPDSAGRIMRDLRQRGEISYVVESRGQSLYRVIA